MPCVSMNSGAKPLLYILGMQIVNSKFAIFAKWEGMCKIKTFPAHSILHTSSSHSLSENVFEEISHFLNGDSMSYPR